MKLIVGLGNPGIEYSHTRHNIGFEAIDNFCKAHNIKLSKENFSGIYSLEHINGIKAIISKPMTFMNLSGNFVQQISHFYKIEPQNILVIHDDMDIEHGKVKIKIGGGSAGQNGIKDIISKIATEQFLRVRVGIGSKNNQHAKNYVLGKFTKSENELNIKVLEKINQIIIDFVNLTPLELVNKYNGL